jgi:hypothetical protein
MSRWLIVTIAGIVIGVLAGVGIAVGGYQHYKNKSTKGTALASQEDDFVGDGFTDDDHL